MNLKAFLKRNGSTLLTCVASVGMIATCVLVAKETPKAVILLEDAENEKEEPLTKKETLILATPVYIPAIAMGAVTLACMFGSNVLGRRQQTALASACILMSENYQRYKSKVKEMYGEDAHRKILDELAIEKSKDVCVSTPGMVACSSLDFGDHDPKDVRLFYDAFSNRYFESTVEKVLQAEYHLNRNFMFGGVISLNEFYDFLGIKRSALGDAVGWSSMNGDICWIDFNHHKVTLDDGLECYVIDMVFEPDEDYLEDL